jgi:hypothetical protein
MEKCSSMFPLTAFNPKVGIQKWLKALHAYKNRSGHPKHDLKH